MKRFFYTIREKFFERKRQPRKTNPEMTVSKEISPEEIQQKIEGILNEKGITDEEEREALKRLGESLATKQEIFLENFKKTVEKFLKLRQQEENKDRDPSLLVKAIESGDPERFLGIFDKIKNKYSNIPELKVPIVEHIQNGFSLKLEDEEIERSFDDFMKNSLNGSLEDVEGVYQQVSSDLREETSIFSEQKYLPENQILKEKKEEEKEETLQVPLSQGGPTVSPIELWARFTREGPEAELMKKLAEIATKIGSLLDRLFRVNYPHRIMRKIIFTDDEKEFQNEIEKLRKGYYNIPATIWRNKGLAILFHRLGFTTESKDHFKNLALICEKARDIRKGLLDLMEKVRELEENMKNMTLDEITNWIDHLKKTAEPELNHFEQGIKALEDYFGSRQPILAKIDKSLLKTVGSSMALWGLTIGWFLPLYLISKMYPAIEKQMK